MGKYLSAELYKVTHRRAYLYGFLAFGLAGVALWLCLIRYFNDASSITFSDMVAAIGSVFSLGLYLVIILCDMVFSDQYKHNTLKNEVSYGLSRSRVYLGKLGMSLLVAVALCAIFLTFFVGLSRLMFPTAEQAWDAAMPGTPWSDGLWLHTSDALSIFGHDLLCALPLWIGGLGFCFMLLTVTRGSTVAVVIYVLVQGGLSGVLNLAALAIPKLASVFHTLQKCLLTTWCNTIGHGAGDPLSCWIVGMAWLAVSTAVGLIVFQKREIN